MAICVPLSDDMSATICGGFWMRQRSVPSITNTLASINATTTMVNIASASAGGILSFATTGNQVALSTIKVGR